MIARFGGWTFDSDRRLVTGEGRPSVHLTPKAFDLLTALVEAAPRVVTKEELHRRLWPDAFVSDVTLVGVVKEVRRAFGEAGHSGPPLIRTSHGVGYAFEGLLPSPAPRSGVNYWLIVGGRRVLLEGPVCVLGRDAAADVRLDEAGVSRRHARIAMGDSGAWLEDLGSKNGTRIGQTACAGRVALRDGDTIHLGPVSIIFRASSGSMSTVTSTADDAD